MLKLEIAYLVLSRGASCNISDCEAVGTTLNFPISICLVTLAQDSNVNYLVVSLLTLIFGLVNTSGNILHLVTGKRKNLLLFLAQSFSFVAIRVHVRNKGSGIVTLNEVRIVNNRFTKADIMSNTLHDVLIKSFIDKVHGFLSVFAPSNKLGDHGVIVH